MTKEEFIHYVNYEGVDLRDITDDDYSIIEFVYMWHPAISNAQGKSEIAVIYRIGGLGLINIMIPDAKRAKELEDTIAKARAELKELKAKYNKAN